jgi:hypothetical protein
MRVLAAFGTAALIIFTVPAVHASPVDAAVQSLADGQVAYAKKGGWHGGGKGWKHGWKGGRRWGHHRGWRGGPPPWASAWPVVEDDLSQPACSCPGSMLAKTSTGSAPRRSERP